MTGHRPLLLSCFAGATWILFGCFTLTVAAEDNLHIAAFNVRRFGVAKTDDADVMKILVNIILRYDLVLIQEITDKTGKAINILLKEVNKESPDGSYDLVVSSRLGRSNQKEQYGFLYRDDKFSVDNSYVYSDPDDVFEREPFVVQWKASAGVKFSTIAIHTKPTDAVAELQHLHLVAEEAMTSSENAIIMGDFNADCDYVRSKDWDTIPLWTESEYIWLIGSDEDTTSTSTTCAYDRIVITNKLKKYLTSNEAEIFRYDTEYSLNSQQALAVSDHYPVEITLKISTKRKRRNGGEL